jgi:hypothetical protein
MTDLYAFTKPGDPARSIIVLNVHPSFALDSPEPTTTEPFAPGALYEVKVDTNGDAIPDLAYSFQFASSEDGKQTATVRCLQGMRAAGAGDKGRERSDRWQTRPPETAVGQAYLASRGIDRFPDGVARWHEGGGSLKRDGGRPLKNAPALVFAATTLGGELRAVQVLYFGPDGKPMVGKKGKKSRYTIGVHKDAALRLPGEGGLLATESSEERSFFMDHDRAAGARRIW